MFYAVLAILFVWLLLAMSMRQPRYLSTLLLNVGPQDESTASALSRTLAEIEGVAEVAVIGAEGIAYLKIEKHVLDEEKLVSFKATEN